MKPVIRILIAATALSTTGAFAQQSGKDSIMKGSTIEVMQKYKPRVRKTQKPEWMPQLPPKDTVIPSLNYEVPQQTLYYSFTSGQLQPLALGMDSVVEPYRNYIKAGLGNISTLYFDAGIGALRGAKYETDFHIHHLSQNSSSNFRQVIMSGIEGEGKFDLSGGKKLHATAVFERNQFSMNDNFENSIPNKPSFTYSTIGASADMATKFTLSGKEINTHPLIELSSSGNSNLRGTDFTIFAPFTHNFSDNIEFGVDALVSTEMYSSSLAGGFSSKANSLLSLTPGMKYVQGDITATGKLSLATAYNGNSYILPQVGINYNLKDPELRLIAGWSSSIDQNKYCSIHEFNPYVGDAYSVIQNRKDELYAGVAGHYQSHITYGVNLKYSSNSALPVYAYSMMFQPHYLMVADKVSYFGLNIQGRYNNSDKWSGGFNMQFNQFYKGTYSNPFGLPMVDLKGDVTVKVLPELVVSGYINMLGGLHSLNENGTDISLPVIFEPGVYAEYSFAKRFGAFLQCNNLLNSKYQRWYGYTSYGINIYGGVRLKF